MEAITAGELITELQKYDRKTLIVSSISLDQDGAMEVAPAIELILATITESVNSETGYKAVEAEKQTNGQQQGLVLLASQ